MNEQLTTEPESLLMVDWDLFMNRAQHVDKVGARKNISSPEEKISKSYGSVKNLSGRITSRLKMTLLYIPNKPLNKIQIDVSSISSPNIK